MFCGLAEGVYAGKREGGLQAVQMAGALAVTALSVSDMQTMIGLGRQTIEQMDGFAGLLLPVVAVLTAATGAATGAAVRQGATVLFSDLLIGAIDTLLVPIVYAYVAVCAAHAAVGNEGLKKLASVLKWVVTSLLTAVLLAFVGYLTASGAIAGSADAAAIKTAKMAISRAVPVVGGILADAAETVLVGAGVLRGTVGIVGMLGVLAICLIPFLQLAFHYLTYKLAAALIGTVSDKRLSDLLDSIGGDAMMDAAREWLLGVTAAAILAALAEGLMQEGGPKRVGRLVCGLVLLAAVFRPAAELTLPAEGGLSGYSAQIEEQADRLRTDTNDWMKLVIEEQCAAYVMDKAAELGITCQVRVTCTQEEAGVFLPWRCSVTGDLAQEEQEQLVREIQSDLDIPAQRQEYIREESP